MEVIAAFLCIVFGYTILKSWLEARSRMHAEKIRLIEKALTSGSLDSETIQELAYGLSGKKPPKREKPPGTRGSVILALGWITLFVGIGIAVLGGVTGSDEPIAAGVLVAVVGFGVTTYPFALRELEARRSGAQ